MKFMLVIELPRKHAETHRKTRVTGIPCVSVAMVTGMRDEPGPVVNDVRLNSFQCSCPGRAQSAGNRTTIQGMKLTGTTTSGEQP
jgi:hypothetical protein